MVAFCLFLALAGGWAASVLGVPLPFMLGSVGATMLAALLRWPIARPGPVLVFPMRVVLGVLIGSTVTPELLTHAKAILGAVLCVPLYVFISSAFGMFYYRWVAGFPRDEAFFAGLPGGLYAMTTFAEDVGVQIRRITICHTLRVTLVVMLIPVGIEYYIGSDIVRGTLGTPTPLTELEFVEIGWLVFAGLVGVLLGRISGLPGALIIGPMIVSGILHVVGVSTAKPPVELAVAAQIILGASVGARFVGETLNNIRRVAGYTLVHVVLMLALSVGFSVVLVDLVGLDPVTGVIGFAPGGLMEMALVALGLHIDVGIIATLHLCRIITILLAGPIIFRLFQSVSRAREP